MRKERFLALLEMTHRLLSIILCISFILFSNLVSADDPSKDQLTLYTVNYPLQYFAERIGGEHVRVAFPAPRDEDPAFWMPDAETIIDYQGADLIFFNGADYAKWVKKVSLPQFRLINTSAAFKDHYIPLSEGVTHQHGPSGEHAHGGTAFTTWMDFSLAARQAGEIKEALNRKRPELKDTFESNYTALEKDLMELDQEMKRMVEGKNDRPLIASHPVYQYFGRRYGLNLKSLHWEPDQEPSENQWREIYTLLRDHPAQWMIWEDDPLPATVQTLEGIGVNSIVFNPCGNKLDQGDFLTVMRQNFENLKRAFQ